MDDVLVVAAVVLLAAAVVLAIRRGDWVAACGWGGLLVFIAYVLRRIL